MVNGISISNLSFTDICINCKTELYTASPAELNRGEGGKQPQIILSRSGPLCPVGF